MATEAPSAALLVVDGGAETDSLLADPALGELALPVEHLTGAPAAIARVETGDAIDVLLLGTRLADPVRIAQRLLSLDRDGAVVILATRELEPELRRAVEVAPFLSGDVSVLATGNPARLGELLRSASARTRERRVQKATLKKRRETPPPLSARYLGTLLDSAPIGIVTVDADGAVIGWNRSAGQMLDVPEVEALGSSFAELFDEPGRPKIGALVERLDATGIGGGAEVVERGERSFELTGARFAIRTGEDGALLILQDVTARIAAEREVTLQTALLEAQAEASVSGIALLMLDGRLERMNRRWSEIWGVDADMIRNERERATLIMLDQVEDPDAFIAGAEQLAATEGGEFSDEVRLKDGRTIERYATHIHGEGGELVGRIWFHTDITARKREEDRLRDTARTLQESLLPPNLPTIEGLELAVRFRPAGTGTQVGGDFYDIFDTRPGQWGIAVGDVCGKGAAAAALTAATRYTVRAASIYEDEPIGVLTVLNEALLRQRAELRFTTLVFCTLDAGATPPVLRTACGGHPRPLLRRADGTTEGVGGRGPLLGVIADPAFWEQETKLAPGDVLLLYTDGLTDALAPARMLDEDALLAELAECGGLSAGEVAERFERLALDGDLDASARDDIAVLVLKVG